MARLCKQCSAPVSVVAGSVDRLDLDGDELCKVALRVEPRQDPVYEVGPPTLPLWEAQFPAPALTKNCDYLMPSVTRFRCSGAPRVQGESRGEGHVSYISENSIVVGVQTHRTADYWGARDWFERANTGDQPVTQRLLAPVLEERTLPALRVVYCDGGVVRRPETKELIHVRRH
ncbi:hypothetical protein GCM10009826_29300 [Humibacillus xanthopallidus]